MVPAGAGLAVGRTEAVSKLALWLERGAFIGAVSSRKGRLEITQDGFVLEVPKRRPLPYVRKGELSEAIPLRSFSLDETAASG